MVILIFLNYLNTMVISEMTFFQFLNHGYELEEQPW
jgi:hypothetical protein